jgi:hypothetical protein
MEGKILKDPLTLPSPAKWRGKKKNEKNLTAPLTFILSRKGREELKGCPPHPNPLPRGGEGIRKMKRFKHLLTLPFPAG